MDVSEGSFKIVCIVQMGKLRSGEISISHSGLPRPSMAELEWDLSFLSTHNLPHYHSCPGKPGRLRPKTVTLSANGSQRKRHKECFAGSFVGGSPQAATKQVSWLQVQSED